MISSREPLSAFEQLEADFNQQQINDNKTLLEKALLLKQLFLELDEHEKTMDNRGIFNEIAKNTIESIEENHGSDYLKGDKFWRHVQLYLESGVRITEEFILKVDADINVLKFTEQNSAIFCFLHNELHFKEANPFYNIFRYLECASKLEDSKAKYNRKVKTFNALIAIFNSDDAVWDESCKKLIADYVGDTWLLNRKGKFVDLLHAVRKEIHDLGKIKTALDDFCKHIKQQCDWLTLAKELTNLHSVQRNSLGF